MKILGINTSTTRGGVALLDGSDLICEEESGKAESFSRSLLVSVEKLLLSNGTEAGKGPPSIVAAHAAHLDADPARAVALGGGDDDAAVAAAEIVDRVVPGDDGSDAGPAAAEALRDRTSDA